MEMHHRLRRDPNWDPRGCNICGQLGHQAAMCPNGNTVNWRAVYGDEIFKLKRPVFESELRDLRRRREINVEDLEKKARDYAKERAESGALDVDDTPQKPEAVPLPEGWAVAKDPTTGKPYYYHKETKKVQWDTPTAETPIN